LLEAKSEHKCLHQVVYCKYQISSFDSSYESKLRSKQTFFTNANPPNENTWLQLPSKLRGLWSRPLSWKVVWSRGRSSQWGSGGGQF